MDVEHCPRCGSDDLAVGSEIVCEDCGWSKDNRQGIEDAY